MDIIVREGTLVTGSDIYKADIGIENGKIVSISGSLLESARMEINAEGKYVFPGFIDAHTHLDLPINDKISSSDDFYTGTLAAAFGGTTSIVDYIVPPNNLSLVDSYKMWQRKAEGNAVIDYGFHMTISDPKDSILEEIKELKRLGISSVKCFMAYVGKYMLSDDQLYRILSESKETEVLVCMHCENGSLLDYRVKKLLEQGNTRPMYHAISRPPLLEAESISRAIDIARLADAPIFIAHLSTGDGLDRIKSARDKAIPVYAETCPQYLILDDSKYELAEKEAAKYICSPPLRHVSNIAQLWKGLFSGDIQVFGTDHCPFTKADKIADLKDFSRIPNGLPGIEDRVNILFSEGVVKRNMNLNKFVAVTSLLPAKIFGLYPEKGNLNIGSDADIVVYDPKQEWIISAKNQHQNVDYNPYEGLKIVGKPKTVISNGEIIIDNDKFIGQKGRGKYIKRKKSSLL